MIQFNLLPDIKIAYIKTQKTKRMVILLSILFSSVSIVIVAILFVSVQIAQKKSLSNITAKIETETKTLNSVTDLDKILTIQNQINSLTALHDKKPVTSRTFGYIVKLTPVGVTISKLDIDFVASNVTITGEAESLTLINKLADSIKFATYTTTQQKDPKRPFTSVVTSPSFGNGKPTYTVVFSFDPVLFSNTEEPALSVPTIISNRSETEKPVSIFKESTKKAGN